MNIDQLTYAFNENVNNNSYSLFTILGFSVFKTLDYLQYNNMRNFLIMSFFDLYLANRGLKQKGSEFIQKYVSDYPDEYPQESINSIFINDSAGLDMVLERTSKNELMEWGALFNGEIIEDSYTINTIYPWNHEYSKKFI